MDRYELNVKMEQIKKLARQKEYAAAARIADTIDFYRIKENKSLQLLADVYEASGKYSQAKDVLIEAYSRTTLGRQFAYRLVKLCIKSGNINEAEDFYDDFINAAPKDNSKYILQYELASAKGQPIEERIKILETYLSDDMDERWAYELAKLYHKSGQKEKCVRQCDDVILWFNDGKYVDKAMELKMLYTPLTKSQQAKYEERWRAKAPSNLNVDEIKVKEYDASNKYNTVNIQNALKESMDVIMNEDDMYAKTPEKGSVQEDLEKTKVVFTDEVVNSLLSHTVKNVTVPNKYNTVPLNPMLNVDSDGQIEMSIEEEPVDDQIEGQMTIGELLDNYEKREKEQAAKNQAAKTQIGNVQTTDNQAENEKNSAELEQTKRLYNTAELQNEIEEAITGAEMADDEDEIEEVMAEAAMAGEENEKVIAGAVALEDDTKNVIAEVTISEDDTKKIISEAAVSGDDAKNIISGAATLGDEIKNIVSGAATSEDDTKNIISEAAASEDDTKKIISEATVSDNETEKIIAEAAMSADEINKSADEIDDEKSEADDDIFDDDLLDDEISERLSDGEEEAQVDLEDKVMDVTTDISDVQIALAEASGAFDNSHYKRPEKQIASAEQIEIKSSSEEMNNVSDKTKASSQEMKNSIDETNNVSDEPKASSAKIPNPSPAEADQNSKQVSNNEVKDLIKDFVSKYSGVQGLDRQLLAVLQEVLINHNTKLIVMGEVKSGKTALAIDLVKIINKIQQVRGRKIAKINGEVLNEGNVSEYFEKLAGMDIIIERAGMLKASVADKIIKEAEKEDSLRIIVLEDEKTNIEAFLSQNNRIDELFKGRVIVKQNKIRDWALVAKKYAESQGYEIDEMGILALHARIDDLYAVSLLIGKSQVEEIIDNAIKKSKNKRLGKILRVFGREREKILREEDFS